MEKSCVTENGVNSNRFSVYKEVTAITIYGRYVKRILDFLLALIGIITLSPLFLVLALLVRTKLGSPIFFKQERPGKNEKIFTLCKFRTMTDKKDENGNLLPDSVRLTKFGKILRATSLDELPELLNILRGDMSIIGPRPLLISYLPYYTEEEKLRHTVRPGLTGLAQVSGRNFIDWDSRFKKDVEYVRNLSFGMDMKVLWLTVRTVLGRSDVAEDTNVTEGNFAEIRKKRLEETGSFERIDNNL
ncbi:lipopolysaccharide/colanic/teichoic acid biosynthesis glycosyltransferase [Kineothrix alysoides]|uniref:Lipopolysaccharide/colanic/teichoic acid biosynthesis glycosyltransferase n=1 Tax=Kineothrix alysoides TaxID=1469948 RepID=A0A4R1R251_9FIRM|nr:sugar transferase [Kineothrix alysoides]TCL59429.1 lipopolysaccharide/colanic/teichoic acid biosynthesis glycosyltransferase [Kineothrix alysoides]